MKQLTLHLLAALVVTCLSPAFGLQWAPSLEEAQTRAAAEGKLVLALFYGTERTRQHNNLREQLLDTESFRTYARDKFVPVELVEPKDRTQAEAIWKHRRISLDYGVSHWPTLLVLTPQGIPTGAVAGGRNHDGNAMRGSFRARSTEERLHLFCDALDDGLLVAQKLREIEVMPDGEDKLRVLVATYYRFPQNVRARHVLARHLATMDPEHKTELQDEYLNIREMVEWGEIGRYGMDIATVRRKQQEMIDKARPANLKDMLSQRCNYLSHYLNSAEDVAAYTHAVEAYATELEKTEPEKAAELRRQHAELYGNDPAEGFRRLQERQEEARRARAREKEEQERERQYKGRLRFFFR